MDSNQKSLVKPGEIFEKQKWNNPSGKDFGAVIRGPSTTKYDQGPLAVINWVKSRLKMGNLWALFEF